MNQKVENAEMLKSLGDLETTFIATTDQIKASVEAANQAIKEAAGDAKTALGYKDQIGKISELVDSTDAIMEQIKEIEQKQVKIAANGGDTTGFKSLGEQFTESEGWKDATSGTFTRDISMQLEGKEAKAITNAPLNNDQPLVRTQHQPGVIIPELRRMTIRDLIPNASTVSNHIEFTREDVFTNNAGYQVAEGDLKGESDITYETDSAAVATIAHFIVASKQVLDDAPMLQGYIDGRLRYGLKLKEEAELLNGAGGAGQLKGLLPAATVYTGQAGDSHADQVRKAQHAVFLADFQATATVMHPTDWLGIELAKDADLNYYFGGPANATQSRIWGGPVVVTQAMTEGTYMTGAFDVAAQIFDREQVNVVISREDRDNFVKNMVTILCEQRLVQLIYRPASFVKSTLVNA